MDSLLVIDSVQNVMHSCTELRLTGEAFSETMLPVVKLCVNLFEQVSQDDVFQNLARNAGQGYWTVVPDLWSGDTLALFQSNGSCPV